jgi:hypothetical protein
MDGMATGRDWERLAACVRERRTDLGLTQEDVRSAGGPSTATMRLIEGALQTSYQPAILARLENALGWRRGSVRRILAGGDPEIADAEPVAAMAQDEHTDLGLQDSGDARDSLTTAVVLAAISPLEAEVWAEIRRHPEGTPADVIFSDPAEIWLWSGELRPEHQRVRQIAALRSVRPPRAGNARRTGLTSIGAAG